MNAFIIFSIIILVGLLVICHMFLWTKMDSMERKDEREKPLYEILNALALVVRSVIILISVIVVCLLIQGSR